MKALHDHDKRMDKVLPIAGITIGVVAAFAGVVAAVAFGVLLTNPFLLPSAMAFSIAMLALPIASATGLIISVPLIGFSIKGLCEIKADHKMGVKYSQFKNYFNKISDEKKWDKETSKKNFNSCFNTYVKYEKCHHRIEISALVEELNTEIKKAEDDVKAPWINQKLFGISENARVLPEDMLNHIASFSSALAAK